MTEKIPVSEAQVKRAVENRLTIAQQQGQLLFLRLNSGSFILANPDGSFRRRVRGAPAGTADFVVFQPWSVRFQKREVVSPEYHTTRVTFLEIKSSAGRQSKEQLEFEEEVKKLHCRYIIVRDAEEIEKLLC